MGGFQGEGGGGRIPCSGLLLVYSLGGLRALKDVHVLWAYGGVAFLPIFFGPLSEFSGYAADK